MAMANAVSYTCAFYLAEGSLSFQKGILSLFMSQQSSEPRSRPHSLVTSQERRRRRVEFSRRREHRLQRAKTPRRVIDGKFMQSARRFHESKQKRPYGSSPWQIEFNAFQVRAIRYGDNWVPMFQDDTPSIQMGNGSVNSS
ncbi:hypothetical protein EYF80_052584 [Liparis tanakae]|uniref:Uncharacterized protein n=1 Tax=Liparis tanakae TaxID=230148 RepID=A0A4Z2F8R5_9TELE|nr:hypothetical protein EYF80_052584 [Liparis tanakae]